MICCPPSFNPNPTLKMPHARAAAAVHHRLLPLLAKPLNCLPTAATAANSGLLFREKLLYLTSLKVNPQKALTQNPNLRSTPLSTITSIERCLLSMGLHRADVGRILDMHPILLSSSPDFQLYPILDFLLHEVLIPFPEIPKSISHCPRILVSSVPNQLRPSLEFLKGLGFVGPNKIDSRTTMLLVNDVEGTLKRKIRFLLGIGFEIGEVNTMVVRSPGILTFSVEKNLVPKADYFLEEMEGNLDELKRFPQFFGFSLEGKIKPRHRKLKELRMQMPLSEMLKVSDGEFNARLVEMRLKMVGERKLAGGKKERLKVK